VERVAFLVESTGEQISCLLNPETLVIRRQAGVRPRPSAGGRLTGSGLSDDPLLYTGGGSTELELDLLFDTSLVARDARVQDVRDLTAPIWNLAENADGGDPPVARFIWGKSWNLPGVVTAVAERLEHFTGSGTPQRSWLRLRFRRISEPKPDGGAPPATDPEQLLVTPADVDTPVEDLPGHVVLGDGSESERLDTLAAQYYGDASYWRVLASFNGIDDPASVPAGTVLRVPPESAVS